MKYKVYYKGDRCLTSLKGDVCILNMKSRHIWPEDDTELSISIDEDMVLSYSIDNLSDRTQYLYDNDLLGLGIFVEENPSWISQKDWWRSDLAKTNHLTKRCIKVFRIDSLSGEIDLSEIGYYPWIGCWSKQLYYVFNFSGSYQDPYVSSGTENIAIGIGRFYDIDESNWMISCFRPHKVSGFTTVEVENKYEG